MTKPFIATGNASIDGTENQGNGWFVGHLQHEFPRKQQAMSVKWSHHANGEHRTSVHEIDERITTLAILVRGKASIHFDDQEVLLEKEGDYVLYTHNLPHQVDFPVDSTIITVRWPSV